MIISQKNLWSSKKSKKNSNIFCINLINKSLMFTGVVAVPAGIIGASFVEILNEGKN